MNRQQDPPVGNTGQPREGAPSRTRTLVWGAALVGGLLLVGVTGCASDTDGGKSSAASTSSSAPRSTVSAAASSSPLRAAPSSAPPVTASSSPLEAAPNSAAAEAIMPNVVCMNLQTAQNTIQAAGVFYSRSSDATGRGRMQVNDRNWIVVSQTPAPGTPFGEGEAVLSVVKLDERNSCG